MVGIELRPARCGHCPNKGVRSKAVAEVPATNVTAQYIAIHFGETLMLNGLRPSVGTVGYAIWGRLSAVLGDHPMPPPPPLPAQTRHTTKITIYGCITKPSLRQANQTGERRGEVRSPGAQLCGA
jgi:hypothetical protein